jgi:hypothetical protein
LKIGDDVIIDRLTEIIEDGDTLLASSNPISLIAGEFIPIKVRYYDITGKAFITLFWSSTS